MKDWDKVKEKNKEKLERLNLPDYKSKGKVFIFDVDCPYSLDEVIDIEPVIEKEDFAMHGTYAAQVVKVIAGDNVKFYGSGYTSDFDRIVDFCINNGIRVINSSMTCTKSKQKEAAIKRFVEWGGVWISSAGNNDDRSVMFPASSEYTIAVSATNSEDCNGKEIDVTADSYWYVRNKNKGYFNVFNGTSCAAPVISGIARIVLDLSPQWKLGDFRQFLIENSITDMKSLEEYESFFSFPSNFMKEGEVLNKPCKIIIHHSLTKDGQVVDFDAIKKYHIETNGWLDIGYHYIIENVNGQYKILKGRDEKTIGAHTIGENANSIGICLVGNFDTNLVPLEQLEKLVELIKDIRDRYGNLPIYGHCDFPNPETGYRKTCPGTKFPWKELGEKMEGNKSDWRIEEGLEVINKLHKEGKLDSPEYWIGLINSNPDFGPLLLLVEKIFSRR